MCQAQMLHGKIKAGNSNAASERNLKVSNSKNQLQLSEPLKRKLNIKLKNIEIKNYYDSRGLYGFMVEILYGYTGNQSCELFCHIKPFTNNSLFRISVLSTSQLSVIYFLDKKILLIWESFARKQGVSSPRCNLYT